MRRSAQGFLPLYRDAVSAYCETARDVARTIYQETGRPVSSDDLADRFPLPAGLHPSNAAHVWKKGFKKVGVDISRRAKRAGGYVGLYIPSEATG